ncbi:MAG: response regulator [Planctomycetota bacterium]|nr:response regulator [Planctomycetota bacterium]
MSDSGNSSPIPSILLVDDDKSYREDLATVLEGEVGPVHIRGCDSAKSARKLLKDNGADVVLSDMVMEDEEAGIDLLHHIKTSNPRTQVIVLTAFPSLNTATRCMRAGCFEFLVKPTKIAQIVATVRKAISVARRSDGTDTLVERLILSYWDQLQTETTKAKRGASLESLMGLLFGTLPGWEKVESRVNSKTEEIDLVILNESTNEFWRRFGPLVIVECKNWSRKTKPGRSDFDSFYSKMSRRGEGNCRLGFFVSVNGVAKTFHVELDRISRDTNSIVILDLDAIWNLICAGDRGALLKQLVTSSMLQ